MVDPRDLVAAARSLSGGTPSDAALRRAVSTAYYALFHAVAGFAADRLAGPDPASAAFTLVYRGLDHKRIKDVLEDLSKPTPPKAVRAALRRSTISEHLRDFANVFVPMQQLRHLADYHPAVSLTPSDTSDLIDEAERALDVFKTIDRCAGLVTASHRPPFALDEAEEGSSVPKPAQSEFPADEVTFEMSNLSPRETGLDFAVFVSLRMASHAARIKVTQPPWGSKPSAVYTIAPFGFAAGDAWLSMSQEDRLRAWAEANLAALLAYWDGDILYDQDLRAVLVPIDGGR